ncbi:hypothetical protein FQE99_08520 [Escherichia coli]|nr:hypothetical protein [Escherichia coli]EEW1772934.1 hypothetical protein [Escherichia coli]EFA5131490.1 hypothetical protein [Escherichia coli]EFB2265048.1 hypothetical protein [Escherichia coli]EFB4726015.1 hypothetical protein [Escherichia coli]
MPENPASYRVVRTKSYLFNKAAMKTFPQVFYLCNIATQSEYSLIFLFMSGPHNLSDHPG